VSGGSNLVSGGSNLVSDGSNLASEGSNLVSGGSNLVSDGWDLVSGGSNLASEGWDLVSGGSNLVSDGWDLVSGGSNLVSEGWDLVSGGSGDADIWLDWLGGLKSSASDGDIDPPDLRDASSAATRSLIPSKLSCTAEVTARVTWSAMAAAQAADGGGPPSTLAEILPPVSRSSKLPTTQPECPPRPLLARRDGIVLDTTYKLTLLKTTTSTHKTTEQTTQAPLLGANCDVPGTAKIMRNVRCLSVFEMYCSVERK
jgi:hypothetical protein